jgi:hypothetical protein
LLWKALTLMRDGYFSLHISSIDFVFNPSLIFSIALSEYLQNGTLPTFKCLKQSGSSFILKYFIAPVVLGGVTHSFIERKMIVFIFTKNHLV